MARLRSIPFELNSLAIEFDLNTGSPVYSTATVRTGSRSLQITSLVSATKKGVFAKIVTAASAGPFYFRVYYNFATFPSAENRIFALPVSGSFGAAHGAYVTIDASGVLRLYADSGQVAGTTTLNTGQWYRLEVHYDKTGTTLEAMVDGFTFAQSTNVTITNSCFGLIVGGNLNAETQTQGNWFIDDGAINDTSGASQTAWPGAGGLTVLWPSGAGDSTAWTIGGSVPAATNWQSVDENPTPDDGTTLVNSNTLNQLDTYNMQDTPGAIGSSDTITLVEGNFRVSGVGASANAGVHLRIYGSQGGSNVDSANGYNSANASWGTNGSNTGNGLMNTPIVAYTNPNGGSWSKSTVDGALLGIRCNPTSTNAAQVSTVWMVVDSTPSTHSGPPNGSLGLMGVGF